MTSQNKNVGFIIALIGGGLGLLAFFAMPFVTVFGVVSVTGQQLASFATQYSQQTSQFGSSSSNNGQALVALWLAPVVAGLIVLIAALQFRSTASLSGKRAAAGWMIALSIIGIVLYVGILIYANSLSSSSNGPSIFSYIGAGYWIYLVSMIGVIVGAAMALSAKAQVQAISGPPPNSSSYPPYQQPQTPSQYPPQYPPYQQPNASQNPSQYPPYQQPGGSSPQYPQYPQYPPTERAPESPQWPPSQPYQ